MYPALILILLWYNQTDIRKIPGEQWDHSKETGTADPNWRYQGYFSSNFNIKKYLQTSMGIQTKDM